MLILLVLTVGKHDCEVNIQCVARELVKRLVNQLEDLHVSNVKVFFTELNNAPFEPFDGCLEVLNGVS